MMDVATLQHGFGSTKVSTRIAVGAPTASFRGRGPVEAAGSVENAPRSPVRVSHRPLDRASGPAHSSYVQLRIRADMRSGMLCAADSSGRR
jgi:hypothetical protein